MPNKKNIEQVKELSSSFEKAKVIYFTEYHGLKCSEISQSCVNVFQRKC